MQLQPVDNINQIQTWLNETNEFLLALHRGESILISNVPFLDKELHLLSIEDAVLQAKQIVQLRNLVITSNHLIKFFADKEIVYPFLKAKIASSNSPRLK